MRSRELRSQGSKVKLQDQPFQVLALLLENPGQLVTREELRARIWPDGVFVDFDKSLSKAISKIREALGDSPENSQFIETLSKRGYRFLVPVEPRQPARLTELPPPGVPAVPRASRVRWGIVTTLAMIIVAGAGLWVWRTRQLTPAGLFAIPLTTYAGFEFQASLSPDGNQVAFAWNGPQQDYFKIYVKQIGTENTLRLTNDPAGDFLPSWSPDGRYIAFLRKRPGARATVLMVPSIGGPPEQKLTETISSDDPIGSALAELSWSPDGKWIAMRDRRPGDVQDSVNLFSIETEEKRKLTFPPPRGGDGAPVFSPDGRSLAFIRTLTFGVSEIYLLELSENLTPKHEPKQLTFAKQWISGLTWTPDGRDIVFSSGSVWYGGSKQLLRVAASGSGKPRVLAFSGEHGGRPTISRHGNRLAFERVYAQDENIWRLELSDPKGIPGGAVKLIASTRNDYMPQYSHDGRRIAFISQRSGGDEVWVSNGDGAGAVQLTSLGAPIVGYPRWSPDGGRIVFDSNLAGNFEVYMIDAGGGRPKRLTTNPADDAAASWSRDGRSIYFVSNRTKSWQVWKMPADGGEAVQVTRNGGYFSFESVDGAFLYYSKPGEKGELWRMPVRGGEETKVLDGVEGNAFSIVDKGIYFNRTAGIGSQSYTPVSQL